jgi:hypothetical protein
MAESDSLVDEQQFPPSESAPLNGIIAHLTQEYRGNVHDMGVVQVLSSSQYHEDRFWDEFSPDPEEFDPDDADEPEISAPKNVADLGSASFFASTYRKAEEDIPPTANNWICYRFVKHLVVPTHYAVRSDPVGKENGPNLKNWSVETSMDGETWKQIDHREDDDSLNGKFVTKIFPTTSATICQFIRLSNIGRNHFGTDCLLISGLEIFGTLIELPEVEFP